jgi:hypothetical protein
VAHRHPVQCCQCGLHREGGLLDQVVARGARQGLGVAG